MQLDNNQIDRLFLFTRQHFVEWYDLQLEIVDHLAIAIEKQWQHNPTLAFEEALQQEFKKFGVFGFMTLVEERQAALSKKYRSIIWQEFKTFLSVPKIVGTLLTVCLLYSILKSSPYRDSIFYGLLLSIIFLAFYQVIRNARIISKKKKNNEKRWLFEEIILQIGGLSAFAFLPFQIFNLILNRVEITTENTLFLLILSCFLVVFALFTYTIFKVILGKANIYLQETYPEYNLVSFF